MTNYHIIDPRIAYPLIYEIQGMTIVSIIFPSDNIHERYSVYIDTKNSKNARFETKKYK